MTNCKNGKGKGTCRRRGGSGAATPPSFDTTRPTTAFACNFGPLGLKHLRQGPTQSKSVAPSFFGDLTLTGFIAARFTGMTGLFFDN